MGKVQQVSWVYFFNASYLHTFILVIEVYTELYRKHYRSRPGKPVGDEIKDKSDIVQGSQDTAAFMPHVRLCVSTSGIPTLISEMFHLKSC